MVGMGSEEMELYLSSRPEERWGGEMLGEGRVEEGVELYRMLKVSVSTISATKIFPPEKLAGKSSE